jgi:hypothetical protein
MVPLERVSIILALSLPCNKRKMWEKLLLTASHSKRSSPGGRRTASLKFPLPRVASMCFRSWAPCFQPAEQNMMTSKGSLLVDVVLLKQKLSTPRSLKFCLQPKPSFMSPQKKTCAHTIPKSAEDWETADIPCSLREYFSWAGMCVDSCPMTCTHSTEQMHSMPYKLWNHWNYWNEKSSTRQQQGLLPILIIFQTWIHLGSLH